MNIKQTPSGNELIHVHVDPDTGRNTLVTINSIIEKATVNTSGQNGLIYGGVEWIENLDFQNSEIKYAINDEIFIVPEGSFTLAAAPTAGNSRIDLVVVNSSGTLEIVQGIADPSPVKPALDPLSQIEVTFILLPSDATAPGGITNVAVYLENAGDPAEWDATENTTGLRIDLASTADPYEQTISIEADALNTDDTITFNTTTPVAISAFNQLSLRIKAKEFWGNGRLNIGIYNGNTLISGFVSIRSSDFDPSNLTLWVLKVFSAAEFGISSTATLFDTKIGRAHV